MTRSLAMLSLALSLCAAARADYVTRRGNVPGLDGEIKAIDDNGITIRSATGAEQTVTWDHIREVITTDPGLQRSIDEHRDSALNLWRARSRLERGDAGLAEPLFDRLFAKYRGHTHETALIVAEGLLRCRLARAANDVAIIPALEVTRLRRKGIKTDAYSVLPAVMDDATGLCTRLPPFWPPTSALARVEPELSAFDSGGDTVVAALATHYRVAAIRQSGRAAETPSAMADEHVGVALMRLIVNASASESEQRAAARASIQKRLPELPDWAKAWAYYAIGDSLARESGDGQQERGVVSLAHLPASFMNQQPYLTALALAKMCAALTRLGDSAGAATLQAEFERQFPGHPAAAIIPSSGAQASLDPNPPPRRGVSVERYSC